MQCLLLLFSDEAGWSTLSVGERQRWMGAYQAYTEALIEAGVFKGANHLLSSAGAATVRVARGKASVMDGPFAETKEHFGGYYVVDVDSLDRAIELAAEVPGARLGSIEVRPIMDFTQMS